MKMLETNRLPLPTGISTATLEAWAQEHRERTAVLQRLIDRFEKKYGCTLPELEARLERGEGPEHPDWEDSIEWRNAVEMRQRLELQGKLFAWLSRSPRFSTNL